MAEEPQTGGMIALVPENPSRLTVPGGDPAAQIHLTLVFLGDGAYEWDDRIKDGVRALGARLATDFGPLEVRIMGHATWNMDGGPDGSMQPCAVYEIADDPLLSELHEMACEGAHREMGDALWPDQHLVFKPHITAGFNIDTSAMKMTGPVRLNMLRVAIGTDVIDYPMTGSRDQANMPMPAYQSEGTEAMAETTVDETKAGEAEVTEEGGELQLHWPCLVIEGMRTGDGRFIPYGSLGARGLPLSVRGQVTADDGHKGAEVFGKITKLERHEGPTVTSKETGEPFSKGTAVWEAWGVGDANSKPGKLALAGYLTGNSVDIADATVEDELADGKPTRTLVNGKIGATTLVPLPAFADGYVEVNGQVVEAQPAIEPVAASAAWNIVDGQFDDEGYELFAAPAMDKRKRALKKGQALPPLEKGGPPRYPIENADDLDNAVRAVGRGKGDHNDIRKKIMAIARKLGLTSHIPDNWQPDGSIKATAASGVQPIPSLSWFQDPGLPRLTPLTREGRHVFGHVADWNRPHISFNGAPIYAAHSRDDYKWFRTGSYPALDEDGNEVSVGVGRLTIGDAGRGADHAPLHLDLQGAQKYHADESLCWAYVAAGEDAFGIWVNGVIKDDADELLVRKAFAHPPSIDQRPIDGHLELAAVHCINTAGIPIPRARVASGEIVALVAAGYVEPAADNPLVMAEVIAERVLTGLIEYFTARAEPTLESRHTEAVLSLRASELVEELGLPFPRADGWKAELTELDADDWAMLLVDPEELAGGRLHIPPYMKRIEKHLMTQGMTESHAIATAVNAAKKMCATGDVNFPGKQNVNPGSRAEACAAVAQWKRDRPGAT